MAAAAFDVTTCKEWYYLDEGFAGLDEEGRTKNRVGPFDTQELAAFFADGGITEKTEVWAPQCEGWETIGTFEALKEVITAGGNDVAAAHATEEEKVAAKTEARTKTKRRGSMVKAPAPGTKSNLTILKELSDKPYVAQAQWFLNAYWKADGKEVKFSEQLEEAEKVWDMYNLIVSLDEEKGKDGNEIDEFKAHVFLEKTVGALTVARKCTLKRREINK